MPTYSTVHLDNLLEPRNRVSYRKPLRLDQVTTEIEAEAATATAAAEPPVATKHIFISPALYTTPEPTPIPDGAPLSPSPYVVNHKRRGGGVGSLRDRRNDGGEVLPVVDVEDRWEFGSGEAVNDIPEGDLLCAQVPDDVEAEDECDEGEEDGFLDSKCESMSVSSATGSVRQFDCRSFVSAQGEFFDAIEDFSSDNSAPTTSVDALNIESEIRVTRLSLLEEIDRRKNVEEALDLMQRRWEKMRDLLSDAKLAYPSPSNAREIMHGENVSMEEVAQEVIVCKYVSEAIAKSLARAEAELDAEVIIQAKDQEISRLRDKLLYYEAVNREMSQRNQEIVEVARKQRQRKKWQKRLFWSCIGLSIVAGVSVVAHSYLPEVSKREELPNDLSGDASCSSEAA